MNTDQIFRFLTISGNYEIIGTANDSDILYSSDYDLQEYWKGGVEGIEYIGKVFKDKFRVATGNPNIYITDFKCGEIGGHPIRWDKKSIKAGIVKQYSRKISFSEALQMNSVIKLDVIALLHGIYQEFSCNYYFNFGGIKNYEKSEKESISDSIQSEIQEFYKKGKSFKALRRLYSFIKEYTNSSSILNSLKEYFNSPIGKINKCKNQIEIMELLLDQKFRKPKRKDLVNNLKWVERNLPKFKLKSEIVKAINCILGLKMKDWKKGMEYLRDFLSKLLDEKTRMWIAENKNISEYIK
nr:MAG: hypothetical protein [Lake Baikal virophage 14]